MSTKVWKVTLALLSLGWTIYNIICMVKKGEVINLNVLLGIVPVITVLYTEIDFIYIMFNKTRAYFSASTISFSTKFQYITISNDNLQEIEGNFRKVIRELGLTFNESKAPRNTNETLYFRINSLKGIEFDAIVTRQKIDDEDIRLILKFEYQISYRDVKAKWNEFEKIRNNFFATYAMKQGTKQRYDLTIKTSQTKFNPFYRLTVRHLGSTNVENFILKFSDESTQITTSPQKIHATSPNPESMNKVIKEYVPLSKIL